MTRIAMLAVMAAACSSSSKPPPQAPLPAGSTVCYAGTTTGNGEQARTIARRIVDPAAGTITEDVSHDAASAHGATSFHVVMAVTGDQFTMTESGGSFAGSGSLMGQPWRWTQWSSVSHIAKAGIEVDSDDELTETGMTATKRIKQGDKLVATVTDVLRTFDCAQWDAVKAALALPPVDDAACSAACRNFATLKFWAANAQLAPDARAAAEADLATKLDAGLPACVTQCRAANDAVATHCMAEAKSADALSTCVQ